MNALRSARSSRLLQTGLVDAKQIAYARYSDGVLWRFVVVELPS